MSKDDEEEARLKAIAEAFASKEKVTHEEAAAIIGDDVVVQLMKLAVRAQMPPLEQVMDSAHLREVVAFPFNPGMAIGECLIAAITIARGAGVEPQWVIDQLRELFDGDGFDRDTCRQPLVFAVEAASRQWRDQVLAVAREREAARVNGGNLS
jgi:hypothetical protein